MGLPLCIASPKQEQTTIPSVIYPLYEVHAVSIKEDNVKFIVIWQNELFKLAGFKQIENQNSSFPFNNRKNVDNLLQYIALNNLCLLYDQKTSFPPSPLLTFSLQSRSTTCWACRPGSQIPSPPNVALLKTQY